MREIEIKLKAPDLSKVEAKLKELGCVFSEPKIQKDVNFIHKNDTKWFESTRSDYAYPRLRIENNKPLRFTVKKPIENEMDCIEHELHIDDAEALRGMMEIFNYIEGVTVKKTRRDCTYNDYTITLDEVEKLGNFVEIEKVVSDGDALKIQNEMFTFAKDILDLEKDSEVMKGYDILMHQLITQKKL